MRLSKIKLAGFKSFVDPTNLVLPSNLAAIVGPNGCGKSNVIDAVRWVMGESSAKHLRGDSMADVIFNGSTSRKPVGQASIELIFDNSDGSVGGQYANYSEVSVKRQVSRDGQSIYFLNGSRCRRRDITDIFLGTGLGPRSYAIIEQGTISRIIEAKPEELRGFIEEAAGVSRYKERRRETENRMRHTQDNLDRLSDLREELAKQLDRLQRQARTAERYKALREEERRLRAELLALRWHALSAEAGQEERRAADLDTAYEAAVAVQRQVEAAIEKERDDYVEATDRFNEVQGRFYALGADIGRIEQIIQHTRERQEQLRQDLARVERALQEADGNLAGDQEELVSLRDVLEMEEPRLREAREEEGRLQEAQAEAEEALQEWQAHRERLNEEAAQPVRTAEVERTRIQHLEQHLLQVGQRMKRLEEEQAVLGTAALEQKIQGLAVQIEDAEAVRNELEAVLEEKRARIQSLREAGSRLSGALHDKRQSLQSGRGRLASLEALQQDALGKRQGAVADWLNAHGLNDRLRLAEGLDVEPGWELAVETVLGHHLEAVCVDQIPDLVGDVSELSAGVLSLFDTLARPAVSPAGATGTPLSEKVRAPWPVMHLLARVCACDGVADALALRQGLAADESVITRDAVWMGSNWLRINRTTDEGAGVLAREHEIKALGTELAGLAEEVQGLDASVQDHREELRALESEEGELRSRLSEAHRRHAALQSQVSGTQARHEQTTSRAQRVAVDLEELHIQKALDEERLAAARQNLQHSLEEMEVLARRREELSRAREGLAGAVESGRRERRSLRERIHESALRIEGIRTRRDSLEKGLARTHDQVVSLQSRHEEMLTALSDSEAPLEEARADLDGKLARRMEVEAELKAARQRVEETDARLRELDQERHRTEQTVQTRRGDLEQSRVNHQTTAVRLQTVEEQLSEYGYEPAQLLETLADGSAEPEWLSRLEDVERRIGRLGPINLAAIDEYAQQSERKDYLDAQHDDLVEALTTLHNAIRRIDRETRTRFKETYDRVNGGLKDTFPRLFGGGHAYLELTSEDLLETGVTVMARPPGKRNSTIHLLSGGEKALTAVALVFSIFELNPAPFCLLDEVDAPLDDANVGRFCGLVKSMSDRVQFMFITHNKTTMELSDHLIGVTMNEPGVSRLVAVDVEEAVEMAAV